MNLFVRRVLGLDRRCLTLFCRIVFVCVLFGAIGLANCSLVADETVSYNRDIRPILAEHCFACHGPDNAAREADLRLDQRDSALENGAIIAGNSDDSELIARLYSDDPDVVMPPPATKKLLSDEDKKLLQRWIDQGANYESHWAFTAPIKAPLPAVADASWAKQPFDQFVLAVLESKGLTPAPEADARTLFRRIHLDITGLPPEPADIVAFVADYEQSHDGALSQWIDRLMARESWGEHRARYWLDAARYGDTHGMHFDNYREMWPYRDWVIRAFNSNQPYDQFVIEQLAGDLLPNPSTDQLVATGFQRCNITTNEGGTIEEENLALYSADRVQTFGWVFLGLTTNCAQCHDHKFDPLTTKDYYALAAYFRNTTQPGLDGNVKDGRAATVMLPNAEDLPRWEALPKEIESTKAQRDARRTTARQDYESWLAGLSNDALSASVSNEGLVFQALMNEGNGTTIATQSKPQFTVEPTGDLEWSANGKFGPSLVFRNGKTLKIGEVGDWEKDAVFSYGAWVKAPNRNGMGGIIARMDEGADFRGWDLWQNGGAYAVHLVDKWPDNALKVRTRDDAVQPNQWQHVFVTYDGSAKPEGIKLYIDGKLEKLTVENNTITSEASLRTTTPTRIGQRSGQQIFGGGSVQDVRLYERLLSDAEISAIATDGFLRTMLEVNAANRTAEQQTAIFEHYLQNVDVAYPALTNAIKKLEDEQAAIRARSPITHVQQERADSTPMTNLLMRGEYDRKGEEVVAQTPSFLQPMPADAPNNRLGLATWLVQSEHPLTARVAVNRYWQQIFGKGIVATAEDFGVMGMPPTNPELLDWLATDFRENGWDVKHFFKSLLMSATYRQSSVTTPQKTELDPGNDWYSRGPRFRMDAEMVRDSALAASGLLSKKLYGPSVKPYQPEGLWDVVGLPEGNTRKYVQDHGEDLHRRSLYTFWKRMAPPPSLEALNAPSREVCSVRRERTNTPLQALVTLNDPQFFEAARVLAQSALPPTPDDSNAAQLAVFEAMALRVLGRSFNENELKVLQSDREDFLHYYEEHPADADSVLQVGESPIKLDIPAPKLAAWVLVANEIMNLDEALNK